MINPDTIGGKRLDNTTFRHDIMPPTSEGVSEIRMSVVGVKDGEDRYKLVETIDHLFHENVDVVTREKLERGIIADIDDEQSSIRGRWLITSRKVGCLFWRILESIVYWVMQWFPCLYTPSIATKIDVTIRKISDCCCCEGLAERISGATAFLHVPPDKGLPDEARILPIPQTEKEIVQLPNFADPATRLSRLCLQTVAGPYLMEACPDSDYCLVIDEGSLRLQRIPDKEDEAYVGRNKEALRYYVSFLTREFGMDFLTQIQETSGIDFGSLIEKGSPLTPDIVSRCNVCANNIEMGHLETFWQRLCILKTRFVAITSGQDREFLWSLPKGKDDRRNFILPWRVVRKLSLAAGSAPEAIRTFLQALIGEEPPRSVQDLPPEKFNQLRALFESTPEELERAFTGRKITHVAISGFNTMGNLNRPNPCRCQAELLQIFEGLKKNFAAFFELVAHVYSKKNNFRLTPDQRKEKWHVGSIIPGPKCDGSQMSSFFTQAVVDDGQGSFSYVLEPACHNYRWQERLLPWIKVYRSTNSNPNSPGWWSSVLADINGSSSPGSLNPDAAYREERAALDKRSLPLWSAYLEVALRLKRDPTKSTTLTYEEALKRSVDELELYLEIVEPLAAVGIIEPLRKDVTAGLMADVERRLLETATKYRERPEDKTAQDIYHIGHSLGAGNAQLFTWHHFPKQRRIPMIGCGSYTAAYNGPALDKAKDEEFMAFGREHKELFRLLQVHFFVMHQLEYGDLVTQGGERHLGTSGYTEDDAAWLQTSAYVFKPNIYDLPVTATALPITTLQTHGRRIQEAVEGEDKDYVRTKLVPSQLEQFHDAWWLPHDLNKIFGYSLLLSPRINEDIRRIVGTILSPLGGILSILFEIEPPVQSHDGVTYVEYDPQSLGRRARVSIR
jgi:hypothetical protein